MKKYLQRFAPVISVLFFCIALWIIHNAFREAHYSELRAALAAISRSRLLLAGLITCLSYGLLIFYDVLAFRYVDHALPYKKIALASFIGYGLSNNLGYSVLSGGSVRFRLYSNWGLDPVDVAKVISFCTVTGWLGFSTLGGIFALLEPAAVLAPLPLPIMPLRALGALLIAFPLGYIAACLLWRRPVQWGSRDFALPSVRLAFAQVVLSSVDYAVAGAILYLLLPVSGGLSYAEFVGLFMIAIVAGLVSQVPGGLGIFESVLVYLLSSRIPASEVFGALIVFRAIYYLFPLGLAGVLLAGYEAARRRVSVKRAREFFGAMAAPLAPQVFALCAFGSGVVLLFSGASPAEHGRLRVLVSFLPMSLIEVSHFLASLVGLSLLLLARALQRRIDAAYWLTAALLGSGVLLSLLKGLDYEEAAVLAVMLAVLLPCHSHFYRKASLFSPRLSLGWMAAVSVVLLCSAWLGLFAHRHVEYSDELWWQFSLRGDAPRFLRATTGVLAMAFLLGLAELFRPAPAKPAPPSAEEWARVETIVRKAPHAAANLALLGDKRFIFNTTGTAFVMHAVTERCWVAMGDPVGTDNERGELIWMFKELCDRHGALPAFYQVRPENLHLYLDAGLSLLKLGEEGRVSLRKFSLEGGGYKDSRYLLRKLDKEGCFFEVIGRDEARGMMPEFRAISEQWLQAKHVREKRFSLGFFNEDYLQRFSHAVVKREGRVIAFTNLWEGSEKQELSPDLMRYSNHAPNGVMEYLFLKLMQWGKEQGYTWFNLGMAPLAGLENRPVAPLWNRLGSAVYRHGEHFYNFQGLRQYKETFKPVWEPRYLASPGGFALPPVLASIAALVSGGITGVVSK